MHAQHTTHTHIQPAESGRIFLHSNKCSILSHAVWSLLGSEQFNTPHVHHESQALCSETLQTKVTLRLQEQEGINVSENVKTKLNGSSFNFLLDTACTAVHTTGPKKLKIIFLFLFFLKSVLHYKRGLSMSHGI